MLAMELPARVSGKFAEDLDTLRFRAVCRVCALVEKLHVLNPHVSHGPSGPLEGRSSANQVELFAFEPVQIIFGQAAITK
jgi:hypothetical protein